MDWSKAEIQETLAAIGRRSVSDAQFRALALSDAKAAVNQVTSKPIPDNFNIQFVEETGVRMTVVLPPTKEGALSEAELELVSGGGGTLKTAPLGLGGLTVGLGGLTVGGGGFTQVGTNTNQFYLKL
jgi:hypothetical protein